MQVMELCNVLMRFRLFLYATAACMLCIMRARFKVTSQDFSRWPAGIIEKKGLVVVLLEARIAVVAWLQSYPLYPLLLRDL